MKTPPAKVALVAKGQVASPESYMCLAETFSAMLERETRPSYRSADPEEKAYETKIFTEGAAALEYLTSSVNDGRRILLFLSEACRREAVEIARQHPQLKVVLMTGARPPRGEVQVVHKEWLGRGSLSPFLS